MGSLERRGSSVMQYFDLKGCLITDGDWYYSIVQGQVIPHCYIEGWPTDEGRLANGRVLRGVEMSKEEATKIFKEKGIYNTKE
jgi:hypothetical protein